MTEEWVTVSLYVSEAFHLGWSADGDGEDTWWPVLTGWYWPIQSLSHAYFLEDVPYWLQGSSSETWGTHTVIHTPLCLSTNNRQQWGLRCSGCFSVSHNSAHSPAAHHNQCCVYTTTAQHKPLRNHIYLSTRVSSSGALWHFSIR